MMWFFENIKNSWEISKHAEESPKCNRKESNATISTVDTFLETVDSFPSPTEENYNHNKVRNDEENIRGKEETIPSNNFCLQIFYKNYHLWLNLSICFLLAIGVSLFISGYFISIPFLDVSGILIVFLAIILIVLKAVIHFSSAGEREKGLPYIGFRYRTREGWLSKHEIFRRETGISGSSRPTPGPNHFF